MTPDALECAVVATMIQARQWGVAILPLDLIRLLPAKLDPPTLELLTALLERPILKTLIVSRQGFCCMAGEADEQIALRHRNYNASITKRWIAVRTVWWLRWIPYLRMVVLTNTLAMGAAKPESDIDVLIVATAGRLWMVRFLVTAMVELLGRRRKGNHITNRLCLSFYCTDDAMDFRQFFVGERDLHYAYWVAMMTPIYVAQGSRTIEKFQKANAWITEYFPQHDWTEMISMFTVHDGWIARRIRQVLEYLLRGRVGDGFEQAFRWIQRKKIYAHTDSRVHQQSVDVVVNDSVLKFHESDSRKESREKWSKDCAGYGVDVALL